MSRGHSYIHSQFGNSHYDPDDHGTFERNLVCLIMPFNSEGMAEVYSAIKDACRNLGLTARRVDENVGSGIVIREIADLIERAEFIVCDLTHERPNVYYELGYAHGVGNEASEILLIAKEGTKLHFDIAPTRVRYYSGMEDLQSMVASCLREMMRVTRQ